MTFADSCQKIAGIAESQRLTKCDKLLQQGRLPKKHGCVQRGAAISFRIHISAVPERFMLIECDEPTRLNGIHERMMSRISLPECDFEKL
jgi:hypothetical protein